MATTDPTAQAPDARVVTPERIAEIRDALKYLERRNEVGQPDHDLLLCASALRDLLTALDAERARVAELNARLCDATLEINSADELLDAVQVARPAATPREIEELRQLWLAADKHAEPEPQDWRALQGYLDHDMIGRLLAIIDGADANRERMICLACGTVTRIAECDCVDETADRQRLVNYADQMAEDARKAGEAARAEALEEAAEHVENWRKDDPETVRSVGLRMKVAEQIRALAARPK